MSFTDKQKEIVQTTFGMVKDADALATTFYARLFEIDPSTRVLFTGDTKEQGKKLIQTLAVVVNALDNLGSIVPAIQDLGKRHVQYGVTLEHGDSVGSALLWGIEATFGDAFAYEVREAWAISYGLIANTAIVVAYPKVIE